MYDDALDPDIRDLLNGMLDRNPKTRFDIDQVVNHRALRKHVSSFLAPLSGEEYSVLIRNFLMNSPTGLTSDAPQEVLKFTGFEENDEGEWINLQDEFRNTGYILNKKPAGFDAFQTFQGGQGGFRSPPNSTHRSANGVANDFSPPPFENAQLQKSFKKQPENPAKKVIKIDNGADAWMESMQSEAAKMGLAPAAPQNLTAAVVRSPVPQTKTVTQPEILNPPVNQFVSAPISGMSAAAKVEDNRQPTPVIYRHNLGALDTPETVKTLAGITTFLTSSPSPFVPSSAQSQEKAEPKRVNLVTAGETIPTTVQVPKQEPKSDRDSPKAQEWSNPALGVKVVKRMYAPNNTPTPTPGNDSVQSLKGSFKDTSLDPRSEASQQESISDTYSFDQSSQRNGTKSMASDQVNEVDNITPFFTVRPDGTQTGPFAGRPIAQGTRTPNNESSADVRVHEANRVAAGMHHFKSEASFVPIASPIASQPYRVITNKSTDPFKTAESNLVERLLSNEELAAKGSKDDTQTAIPVTDNGVQAQTNGHNFLDARRVSGKTFKINLSIVGPTRPNESFTEVVRQPAAYHRALIPAPETLEARGLIRSLNTLPDTQPVTIRPQEPQSKVENAKPPVKYFKIS